MYPGEKNVHMKNQIYILGSKVEMDQPDLDIAGHHLHSPNSRNQRYISEYHRTVEEAAKMMATGEARKILDSMRPAGVVQDKEFNLTNIEQSVMLNSHRRNDSMGPPLQFNSPNKLLAGIEAARAINGRNIHEDLMFERRPVESRSMKGQMRPIKM